MVSKILTVGLLFMYAVTAEVANKYKDILLDKHNELRRKQQGSNINKLVWSDTLAKEADAWISRCNFEHENKGRGENLAFNTGEDEMVNINTAFENWYNEIKQYNYAGKDCGVSGSCHYTQLVWSNTREVGCAIKRCPSLSVFGKSVANGWMIGCWYDPKGNDVSEYPFLKGAACSQCLEGQTCEDGLCAGKGKEKCEDLDENCEMYEASNQCEANAAYMTKKCRLSCGLCEGGEANKKPCEDKSPLCQKYGTQTCQSNIAYMKPNCRKTCGFC